MATSNPTISHAGLATPSGPSLYERLNSDWHERALKLFMVVVLGHWAEHLAQAWQIYVMGWPRPRANGVLGLWYPWLIKSETMHYGYALVMLTGLWVLRRGFTGTGRKWWTVALVIQFWHHFEHLLLISQATLHHNLFGKPVPCSILQLFFPRVELHLFYNSIVFVPMVIGMYYHMFPPAGEASQMQCTCAWQKDGLDDEVAADRV
ncbi:MAG TPA: hypothetical protein VGD59_12400 [Acidisarcina sp.]